MNSITLKWGTLKGWEIETDEAKEALQKYADFGMSMGCATQHDSPEQKQALIDALPFMDEIWLDWEGKQVNAEEAREYILNYGNEK